MHRLFLDANVLFSAAYREGAGLLKLWEVGDAQVVTSRYAAAEAQRNLATKDQRDRLETLLNKVELVDEADSRIIEPDERLPEKDRPILWAAVQANATHLITGDLAHFGQFFSQRIRGVMIMSPSDYLRSRKTS